MMEIKLPRGLVAIVDDEDFDVIGRMKWHAVKEGTNLYAKRARTLSDDPSEPLNIYMHRAVVGPPPEGTVTDHVNGNGLDNRRSNLRFATYSQNISNQRKLHPNKTSRYKGVFWNKTSGKWSAMISSVKWTKPRYLGSFVSEDDAALAFDRATRECHGEFAATNFDLAGNFQLRKDEPALGKHDQPRYGDDVVREIRDLKALGFTHHEIALRVGCKKTWVGQVVLGQRRGSVC